MEMPAYGLRFATSGAALRRAQRARFSAIRRKENLEDVNVDLWIGSRLQRIDRRQGRTFYHQAGQSACGIGAGVDIDAVSSHLDVVAGRVAVYDNLAEILARIQKWLANPERVLRSGAPAPCAALRRHGRRKSRRMQMTAAAPGRTGCASAAMRDERLPAIRRSWPCCRHRSRTKPAFPFPKTQPSIEQGGIAQTFERDLFVDCLSGIHARRCRGARSIDRSSRANDLHDRCNRQEIRKWPWSPDGRPGRRPSCAGVHRAGRAAHECLRSRRSVFLPAVKEDVPVPQVAQHPPRKPACLMNLRKRENYQPHIAKLCIRTCAIRSYFR